MAGNARFHDKQHRKNHHTLSSYGFNDSATDPIASPLEPFQGDFVINGALSCNKGFSVLSADIPGDIYCDNLHVRSKTYTDFISGSNTETIISDGILTGYGSNTLTLDYGKAIYSRINSTTVMYMNSSNVGIGTDSPTQKLHVVGNVLITGSLSALGDLTVLDTNVVTTSSMVIDTNDTTDALRITQRGTGNVLVVEDSMNADSTPFIITNSGDVGIGTNFPTSKLHVNGALTLDSQQLTLSDVESKHLSAVYIKFTSPKFLDKEYAFLREIGGFNNFHLALDLHDDPNGNLGQAFSIRNVKAGIPNEINTNFTIDTYGKVGIGTPSPSKELTVVGDISATGQLFLQNSNNYTSIRLGSNDDAGFHITKEEATASTPNSFNIWTGAWGTSPVSRMSILTSGNVGIGVINPLAKLHIKGETTTPIAGGIGVSQLMLNNSAADYPWMRFGVSMYNGDYNPITQTGDQAIIFSGQVTTANSVSSNLVIAPHSNTIGGIRITSNGIVGVNTSSPNSACKLDVGGSVAIGSRMHLGNDGTDMFWFKTADNNLEGVSNGVPAWNNGIAYGIQTNGTYITSHTWVTSGLTRMYLNEAGNIGIGTASPNQKLTVIGDLSATGSIYTDNIPAKIATDITTNYILNTTNSNQIIGVNSSTPITITVPADSTANLVIGTNIVIYQKGSGQVTIAAEAGVSLLSNSGKVKTTGQYSSIALFKLGSNSWLLGGDLTS